MKRNRIVISLDEKQAGGGARRQFGSGAGRPLLIIAIILLVVIGGLGAGGYFWWRHYQSSPAYSLAVLVDAAQRNDGAAVDGLLDTGKISDDFVAQVRQKLPSSPVDSTLWPAPLDSIKTSASSKLKQTVHDQLIKELQQLTDVAAGKPFIIVALAVPRFVDINEQDKVAHATANIKDQQIQLTMESDGQRWRIVAVKDDKLAKLVADSLVHSVPANGSQLQDSIRKQLEGLK